MAIKKILLVASFLLLLIQTYANTAYFKHLSVQDGLSQVNIISIYQDETGALWFGSFEGINRYNGQSVTVFHKLRANNVSNIYYNNDTLWIAGRNKLEFRVEGDSTIRLLTTFKENTRVSSPICCTDDGYIYIGINKGLLRIDRAQPERQHSLLPDIKVQSLYQDSQKNLWICTSRQGVLSKMT